MGGVSGCLTVGFGWFWDQMLVKVGLMTRLQWLWTLASPLSIAWYLLTAFATRWRWLSAYRETVDGILVLEVTGLGPRAWTRWWKLPGNSARRRGGAWGGPVVVVVDASDNELVEHEIDHVRSDFAKWGPLTQPVYWLLLARHGYRAHPWEVRARMVGARWRR